MPTIDFLWDEWSDNVLQETDENNVVTTYFQRPEKYGEVLYHKAGSRFSFYHFDGNGSTRKLTNVSQGTIKTFIFSGFGEIVASSGTGSTPFAYKGAAGYYTNPVTNDIYVRARTYEPATGHWLSKDPLGFIDGPNLFKAYFVPSGRDPSGRSCQFTAETYHVIDPKIADNPRRLPVATVDGEITVNRRMCGFQSQCGFYRIDTVIDSASFDKGVWTVLPRNWPGGFFGSLLAGGAHLEVLGLPAGCTYSVAFDKKSRFPGAPRAIVTVVCTIECNQASCLCDDAAGTAAITYFAPGGDFFSEPQPFVDILQQLRFDWRVILLNESPVCNWENCTTYLEYSQEPKVIDRHIGPGSEIPPGLRPLPSCIGMTIS